MTGALPASRAGRLAQLESVALADNLCVSMPVKRG